MISMVLFLGGCKAKKEAASPQGSEIPTVATKPMIIGGNNDVRAIPNATIFRMSGDYVNNVAITLNHDGTLAYYPDPADITANSTPYALGNGWYLNRQGIGPNSRFTSYSFEEYRNLPALPSQKDLISSIIPGAVVTEFIEIPVPVSQAITDPAACKKYIPK